MEHTVFGVPGNCLSTHLENVVPKLKPVIQNVYGDCASKCVHEDGAFRRHAYTEKAKN